MERRSGLLVLGVGVFVVAATATVLDWVWYTFGVGHSIPAGVTHGVVLLTVAGGALGAAAGRPLRGLPIGAIAGVGAALSYYLFVSVLDERTYGAAIPAAWVVMWLSMAALEGRFLRAPERRSWLEVVIRGAAAAGLGGLAFGLVMNTLWGEPPQTGRNYAVQLAAWAFAWAPGLLALALGRR